MYQISSIFTLGSDTQSSCLRITQGRTGTNLEILLLSGTPCFHVAGFYFQICQITTTTLQGTNGYIQTAEEFYGVGPHLVIPIHGILRLTQNYHLLLFELVYTVYTSLLDAVGTYFLTEARRIRSHGNGQALLFYDLTLELTDHGMLGSTDQVQILSFNLIHHGFHFCKAHNAVYYAAADHERRNAIGESLIDHEVSRIADHCRMDSCCITHQIIETITAGTSCTLLIQTVQTIQDICMIRNLKIRNYGLAEFLDLYVLAVVLTDRHRFINDIGNDHHDLGDLLLQFGLGSFQFSQTLCTGRYFCFLGFCLFLFALTHQCTDFFGNTVSGCTQIICFLLCLSALGIQCDHLIYQGELFILEFFADVLLDHLGIFS